ncbi:unnamed protein product [Caretta caretta]
MKFLILYLKTTMQVSKCGLVNCFNPERTDCFKGERVCPNKDKPEGCTDMTALAVWENTSSPETLHKVVLHATEQPRTKEEQY